MLKLIDPNTFRQALKVDDYGYTDVVRVNLALEKTGTTLIECKACSNHDTESCPENKVWCRMLRRYMEPCGYCSYGTKGATRC